MFHKSSFILVFMTTLLMSCRESTINSPSRTQFSESLVAKVLETVRTEYVVEPDESKMLEGALNGMLIALDPYSCFFTPDSYKIYSDSQKGEFGGLGLNVILMDNILKVISPMDDMPAQKAGIKAGDVITHIDNTRLLDLSSVEVFKRLHGKPGTSVSLTIVRGASTPFVVKVIRDLIIVKPVKHRTQGNIGYIRVSAFNDQTTDMLTKAIQSIQKSLKGNLKGLVLDLRNNPGGATEQAVSVANLFLESGTIVRIKSRHPAHNNTFKASGKDLIKGIPIAVVINKGSASASEIVAAALRDNHRAVLIGEKTFGKGSVQDHFNIENHGVIKLTIARFYTPNGDEIQGKGIQPDIDLSPPTPNILKNIEEITESDDKQLQQAIELLGRLWAVKTQP